MELIEIANKFRESPKELALGPSSLELLANGEFRLNDDQAIAVPDNLMRLLSLIREGSAEHRSFLIRLIRHFRSRRWQAGF